MQMEALQTMLQKLETFITHPFVAPFFFIGLWFGINWLCYRISGWRRLEQKFRFKGQKPTESLVVGFAKVNGVKSCSCLHLGITSNGLVMWMWFSWPFFKAVLIPFSDIAIRPSFGVLPCSNTISFRSVPKVSVYISGKRIGPIVEQLYKQTGSQQRDPIDAAAHRD